LAARDDELVAPAQLFAAEHLVGTPACHIRKALAPCRHVGLFMGKTILDEAWPGIARWLGEPMPSAQVRSRQSKVSNSLRARSRSNRPGVLRNAS